MVQAAHEAGEALRCTDRGETRYAARDARPPRLCVRSAALTNTTANDTPLGSPVAHEATFADRHIGLTAANRAAMLEAIGYPSMAAFVDDAVPADIRDPERLALPPAADEPTVAAELRALADRNRVLQPMIGLGYYGTHTPPVIRRNVLENPSWYTAYTPYQPEISQGRLEALLNFQTMVEDLSGLAVAGASLLDEATAAAEALALARRQSRAPADAVFVVDADTHPQTIAVLRTRAEPLGIELRIQAVDAPLPDSVFGVLLSSPASSGAVRDLGEIIAGARAAGALVIVATDLLALTRIRTPGEWGADIAVGSAQRFGVPLGFGGPHAGWLAVRAGLERALPGRLVGVSVDAAGKPAYRLALQTREQHIRRERATSNICTAQVLLAVMAGMYAAWHGPEGLTAIADRVHDSARRLASALARAGVSVRHEAFFDTVQVDVPGRAAQVVAAAAVAGVNLWAVSGDVVSIACDETTTDAHLDVVLAACDVAPGQLGAADTLGQLPLGVRRSTGFLSHPVFHQHRSETAMLRYLKMLADRDFALDRGMIPLGSCTMKLNSTTEMEPISLPGFANMHPFAPADQTAGYDLLIAELEGWLAQVTGYDAVSLQPNAGSQGEFAGLLAIRAWHRARKEAHRDVCLIPSSAHGTNAASAAMAGMTVAVVACDDEGNVDLVDLRRLVDLHADRLAALMITYPSTHGVYEVAVREICALVHSAGGQVYLDGANLNALVGLSGPGRFGADVSHLNLHKTFCIPHGGGGPGVGPVAVRSHLAPYLPNHPLRTPHTGLAEGAAGVGAVSAAPFGSAGILPIPWAYIRLMGPDGLRAATESAILAANYLAARLAPHFPVLFRGATGRVAHECILDLRPLTKATGVTVDDVAKRLTDYGFHAPTMSFPVAGTLMVEPTESEDLGELDRFCEAMIAIRAEIDELAAGTWPADDNPLRNAPHTAEMLVAEWAHPYSRERAVFPAPGQAARKYWPPVRRIDGAFGDRNLVCSCPPIEAYA
jgi:glycine dehydrogenase